MVSDIARQLWESKLGPINWATAFGGHSALIAEADPGNFIAHVRVLDQEALDVLARRPAGRATPINLSALSASDDVSGLDSHMLSVVGAEPIALAPLENLPASVQSLSIVGALVRGRERLQVASLRHLKCLSADWARLDLSRGFGPDLRCLWVDLYGPPDLRDVAVEGSEKIESLTITRARSLENIESLERFANLTHLTLYSCSRLRDLSALSRLPSLRHISIESCRKIGSIAGVLPTGIETLVVMDCGAIDSIRPIAQFPSLRAVGFNGDTKVVDLDLSPLLALPMLESVLIASRRDYRPPAEEVARRFGEWKPVKEPC